MITKEDLLQWLEKIDKKLDREIKVVAVGGTAMTLSNLKESTRDVDFCVESKNLAEFKKLIKSDLFIVDLFQEGYIFSLQLPEDYLELAQDYDMDFKHLKLKILKIEDIILTKTARLNARDMEDIKILAKTKKIDLDFLKKRFANIYDSYAGREKDFKYHFNLVLKMFFS
ncbi:MAG: DUF6036 family nucleotidyltransferase [Nanoarchaeota archaeon]|nr:hypothetical protein [Nanoarchaeota archaeon]MBU1632210.1 hypothetical protein [Nanoarchaeota archaeon]MBU1876377.1 hypothetical protein [Nanoarchaeota archaeon]